jgi:superfamily II DNA/RNA helicase
VAWRRRPRRRDGAKTILLLYPARMPFTGLGLDPVLLRAVRELGFARPTPIQKDAIPHRRCGDATSSRAR